MMNILMINTQCIESQYVEKRNGFTDFVMISKLRNKKREPINLIDSRFFCFYSNFKPLTAM